MGANAGQQELTWANGGQQELGGLMGVMELSPYYGYWVGVVGIS